jgi:hypothetical protein
MKKLRELYGEHITTRCVTSMTFEHAMLDAFDQLDLYYDESIRDEHAVSRDRSLTAQYAAIRVAIEKSNQSTSAVESRRIIPPQLTPQRLAQFIGSQQMCWVLEDFHKVHESQKKLLAQSLKVFVDESAHFPELKIVAIGAVGTAREVVEHDPEMRTRVSEVLVPLMSEQELTEVLNHGERLLNVRFSSRQKSEIVRFSNGLGAVCHDLGLNACRVADIEHTQSTTYDFTEGDFAKAIERYVHSSSDTLRAMFDQALRRDRVRKYDNTRLILTALAAGGQDGMLFGEILAAIRRETPSYPPTNLTVYLAELQRSERGALIRYNAATNCYSFADPLYQSFCRALLLRDNTHHAPRSVSLFEQTLFEALSKAIARNPSLRITIHGPSPGGGPA